MFVAGDDLAADRGLDRDLEQLARISSLQLPPVAPAV
jgi:hypothetical protein